MQQVESLPIYASIDQAGRQLPVMVMRAPQGGACVWLVANAHGDEVTGIAVIGRVVQQIQQMGGLRRGALCVMPVMNPFANDTLTRNVPLDDENLNRQYPGDPEGSFTQRLAHHIYRRILRSSPDLVIDLHTMHITETLPFIILDRCLDRCREEVPGRLYEMAQHFGITSVYDFPLERYRREELDRSLTGALLNRANVLAYTVELGPHRVISEPYVQIGVSGVLNTLRALRMLDGDTDWQHSTYLHNTPPLRRDDPIRVNSTGLVEYLVQPGEAVQVGQSLAQVRDLFGAIVETVSSPSAGYVLYFGLRSAVYPGAAILTLAVADD